MIGFLCEGEFDCMIVQQELGDILGAATLGSSAIKLNLVDWGPYLMGLKTILVSFDNDPAGIQGRDKLCTAPQKLDTKMMFLS